MIHDNHNLSSPMDIIASPMDIIAIKTNNISDQYSTKNSCFGPLQNSPPSIWNSRLNKRLGDSPIKYEYLGSKK